MGGLSIWRLLVLLALAIPVLGCASVITVRGRAAMVQCAAVVVESSTGTTYVLDAAGGWDAGVEGKRISVTGRLVTKYVPATQEKCGALGLALEKALGKLGPGPDHPMWFVILEPRWTLDAPQPSPL